MKNDIRQALDYLNASKTRATYDAMKGYLGFGAFDKVDWREVLGPPRMYTSWVVNKKTGMPQGYQPTELDPDLLANEMVITKGKLLLAEVEEHAAGDRPSDPMARFSRKVEVADCHGNNAAVACPACRKAFVVSGFLNKGARSCPHCGKSRAVFAEVKTEWEETHKNDVVDSEQKATRMVFKKEWLGYDVWVSFPEDGAAYRYPHDQLLQTFISRLGIIEGTKSWDNDGVYSFPRLSGEQKKMLKRYLVGADQSPAATQAAETQIIIPEPRTASNPDDLRDE